MLKKRNLLYSILYSMIRGGLLLLLILWAQQLLAQVPGFFIKEGSKKVELPFINSNSLILIPVSINGHPPLHFLLDTGVKANLLFSKTLGDSLGLSYSRRISILGADGVSPIWAQVSPINTLDLGAVEGRFQSLVVLEEDFLELEAVIGIPVYGILGYEFFKYNAVKIDYDQAKLTFFPPENYGLKGVFYQKLPISLEDGKAYIPVKVSQAKGERLKAKVLIDTGANHGLLLNRETSSQIVLPDRVLESQLGQSLGGVVYGSIGRVKGLSFGGLWLQDVLTSFPEESAYSTFIQASQRNGSIGAEVLGKTKLILDYPHQKFFIKRGATFYQPFEFDMSGLVIKKVLTKEKRFYIGDVREGSPAQQSGLMPFDEILKINSVPIQFWEIESVVKLLRSEEGREITLEIRRYLNNDLRQFTDMSISLQLKKQL
jgi:predicted aspartyl protease